MYDDIIIYVVDRINDDYKNSSATLDIIKDIYNHIADKIGLGKAIITINSKKNIYSNQMVTNNITMYESEEYSIENPIEYNDSMDKGISYSVVYFPKKEFNDEQRLCINRINNLFYKMLSRSRLEKVIKETPYIDSLVGYYNTAGINRFLSMKKAQNELDKYTTVFFNIVDCKSINKICGSFKNGNLAMIEYANTINSYLDEDEIIGRYGGDNFCLIIKKEHRDEILDKLKSVPINVTIEGKKLDMEIKSIIGFYNIKQDDTVIETMDNSNTAMQLAKKIKNVQVLKYNEEVRNKVEVRRTIKEEFPTALEENRIVPYFQPKVDLISNQLTGAEVLTRWVSTDNQIILPSMFISALETEEMICNLDFYILDKTCEIIKKQIDNGMIPVPVSVNFSRYHFLNKKYDGESKFIDRIINTISKNEIDPKYIEVEFTESGRVDDYSQLINYVNRLHKEGIKVSIDDYGTGYSSLKLLEQVDFDTIKMDKSFADRIGTPSGDIIFTSTTDMIKKLGKRIVCEGVETQKQIDFLKEINCNIVQGYYFDKPLPEKEYVKRLTNKKYK